MSKDAKPRNKALWIVGGIVLFFMLGSGCVCAGFLGLNIMAAEGQKCKNSASQAECQTCCAQTSKLGKNGRWDPNGPRRCGCY